MEHTLTRHEYSQISAGFNDNPLRSWSINSRTYTDPKFLAVEQQSVFKNSWQFVSHEEKLRDNNAYVVCDVQGASILLVRDGDNQLRAFYNACKHRGHEFMSGEGNVRVITCPYHAWTYNLDGQLRAARRSEHLEDFEPGSICLDQVQVEVFCHLVCINLDPDAAPLKEQSGDPGLEIANYAPDLASLPYAHSLHYRMLPGIYTSPKTSRIDN